MSRPRPRPRPRPVTKSSTASNAGPSKSTSTTPVVEDTDEMFMRNSSRNFQTFRQIDQRNKELKKQRDEDSEDDSDASAEVKRKGKKRTKSPSWSPPKKKARRIPDIDLTLSDSDDDITFLEAGPAGKRKQKTRPRSRSRSITPPPALPEHQIRAVRSVIRQAYEENKPNADDEDDNMYADRTMDSITLDPELRRIANQAKLQRESSQPAEADEQIDITVRWKPHPLNQAGQPSTSDFRIGRNDAFHELFEAVADEQCIPIENVIITYKDRRIFPSSSARTFEIWGSATFTACNKNTYEYLRDKVNAQQPVEDQDAGDDSDRIEILSDDDGGGGGENTEDWGRQASLAPSQADDDGDKFKLRFKSASTQGEITLTVRPTTTCGAIVKAFLKKAKLEDQYPHLFAAASPQKRGKKAAPVKNPKLSVDGDTMDASAPISEADLDDGDLVDVVGL
ncbi:hypothetical protein CYLTODRAFT_458645 [Cylindrobasidium torrendii FP15055 ss-10]|uniref:Rad60/SUMO-like domain-containing protein n=1 Tax=Cylindrobasidium torrendii FP15055 ss-10 TaxID=1314674 RepID=A0A0D7B005_9AGAR|nr:hypothetical protein CYLTODRAFT_458645 [Cylindrobasidium torrendii FP15055 ss-10]